MGRIGNVNRDVRHWYVSRLSQSEWMTAHNKCHFCTVFLLDLCRWLCWLTVIALASLVLYLVLVLFGQPFLTLLKRDTPELKDVDLRWGVGFVLGMATVTAIAFVIGGVWLLWQFGRMLYNDPTYLKVCTEDDVAVTTPDQTGSTVIDISISDSSGNE